MAKRTTYIIMLAAMLAMTSVSTSCYFDKEETLYGGVCDTSVVSYSQTIIPILSNYCYRCHSEVNAPVSGDGLILEGYNNLLIYLQQNEQTIINSVKQNGLAKPMPDDGGKIDKCSISYLEAWILQGKKNN